MLTTCSVAEEGLALVSVLDADRLHDRILASMVRASDARGAALWTVDEEGGLVLRACRGLVDRARLPARLATDAVLHGGATPGLAVPLRADGEQVGLTLLDGPERGGFGPAERSAVAELAPFAAVALRNARRFAAAERVPSRSDPGGCGRLSSFFDYAAKELDKARRYGRKASLALVAIDGLSSGERLDSAMRAVLEALSGIARETDVITRASQAEHCVLLPETDCFGAFAFARRAAREIERHPGTRASLRDKVLALAIGTATSPQDGRGPDQLVRTCRVRQEMHRSSMLHRLPAGLDRKDLWSLADVLLDPAGSEPSASSSRAPIDLELARIIRNEVARELARGPQVAGVVHLSDPGPAGRAELAEALGPGEDAAGRRVFLLSPGASAEPPSLIHPLITRIVVGRDPRLEGRTFVSFASERAAFALFTGPGGRSFHTSDAPLVHEIIARLEASYDLPAA